MVTQKHPENPGSPQRMFTATEVAEYEFCPLVWWYEQYEPLVEADNDELFARMVELEHEYGTEAPALPEYQVVEQLLVRRNAFEQGQQEHQEHADQVAEIAEIEEERAIQPAAYIRPRMLIGIIAALVVLALILMLVPLLLPH